ncbi:orotate phosphoribosyltransferase [Candidatus Peregrinibacteria bacterium]|nr:orotate phosphoribosyltransferase [Candidatus Peregrinibacteria bacterium]
MGENKGHAIAKILLDVGAVKISANPSFTWTSGIKSPVYCDNRKLISHPRERDAITGAFAEMVSAAQHEAPESAPEFIGGTATAAIPWAAFLAYELDMPMIYIRPEKKAHGVGKQVEGDLPSGKRVLIVEDLISTGGSSVAAAEAVKRECGGIVTDVFAIVSWELEEAKKNFSEAGLRLTALTGFSNIVDLALERNAISKAEGKLIMEFKKNPRGWGEKL